METERVELRRYALLSVAAALLTIVLKGLAYQLTGSIGLLSDALESIVNLVAALVALVALTVAAQPPDDDHAYGHTKVEYFSSGAEGSLIIVASLSILATAIGRLLRPQDLHQLDVGLLVSLLAGVLNLVVARILISASRQHRSVVLEADAHHLMTDVYTTAGVLAGVAAVWATGWRWLDPVVAILVAIHIMIVGAGILRRSALGLMDTALPPHELARIDEILQAYKSKGVTFHALRTRQGGVQRYMSVHVQVPGAWSVSRGHTLLEEIEKDLRQELFPILILTHLEPMEDPVSWADISMNRPEDTQPSSS